MGEVVESRNEATGEDYTNEGRFYNPQLCMASLKGCKFRQEDK
jgi:hypothetical protein